MNELQRQHYLSALGVDTYMPRWHLPFAPISVLCELPVAGVETSSLDKLEVKTESVAVPTYSQPVLKTISSDVSPVDSLIGDMLDAKKVLRSAAVAVSAADILAQLDAKPVTIEPFSLSIWRPLDGVMIVDSRNTKLALPTELLLNNILRSVFSNQALKPQEEVLRWPMIENSFAKRTLDDARIELQTWLSVQHEIRPVRQLWLLGGNATMYLLPETVTYIDVLFKSQSLNDLPINALVLPSLNELLQKPNAKQQLFSAISRYQLVSR
jgi:hypothetical protein